MTIIPIVFIICHMPIAIYSTYHLIAQICHTVYEIRTSLNLSNFGEHYIYLFAMNILIFINNCINPLIYVLGSKKLRKKITSKIAMTLRLYKDTHIPQPRNGTNGNLHQEDMQLRSIHGFDHKTATTAIP